MTATAQRALGILRDKGPMWPDRFYLLMWPNGRWIGCDPGSSKGGPSRSQCVANWYLGKLETSGGWVRRELRRDSPSRGEWYITAAGLMALRDREGPR